jgi:hypothetical protein
MNRTERRRTIAERAAEISFYCDECGELISPPRDSAAFAAYVSGELSCADAVALLRGAHDRHLHSKYDQVRRERVARLRESGADWAEAHDIARRYARTVVRAYL